VRLLRGSRGGCAGIVVVPGAIFGIAQQVVGGNEPLQLRVAGRATGGGATRIGMNIPQLGAKCVIDLCGRGDRSHPQHGIGIVIFDHGNTLVVLSGTQLGGQTTPGDFALSYVSVASWRIVRAAAGTGHRRQAPSLQ
jgi:hypothetical protein